MTNETENSKPEFGGNAVSSPKETAEVKPETVNPATQVPEAKAQKVEHEEESHNYSDLYGSEEVKWSSRLRDKIKLFCRRRWREILQISCAFIALIGTLGFGFSMGIEVAKNEATQSRFEAAWANVFEAIPNSESRKSLESLIQNHRKLLHERMALLVGVKTLSSKIEKENSRLLVEISLSEMTIERHPLFRNANAKTLLKNELLLIKEGWIP